MLRWGNQTHPWHAGTFASSPASASTDLELTEEVINKYHRLSSTGQMQPRTSLMPDYASADHATMDKKATLCLLMEAFM